MLVSIIVPIYNVENYLVDCIESIINQTYKNIEIILINDGSNDNSPKICDEYQKKDKRIKVIHKQNSGLSETRNIGLNIAKGEYIYFVDSDDFLEKRAVEFLLEEAIYHSADFIFYDANIVGDKSNPAFPPNKYLRKGLYPARLDGLRMLDKLLLNDEYSSSVPLLFINNRIIKKNNLHFFKGILHEDQLFTFLLFFYSDKVVNLSIPLYNRRIRKSSIMVSGVKPYNLKSMMIVFYEIAKIYFSINSSEFKKEVTHKFLNYILWGIKSIYEQLSFKDKINLYKDLNNFKKFFKNNNYLYDYNIKKVLKKISIFQTINYVYYLKKILPNSFKNLLKKIFFKLKVLFR